jgi:hypothetical protein
VEYICLSHRGRFLLHNRRDQSYFIHDRKYIKDKTEIGDEKVRGHDLCRIIPSHKCTKRSEIISVVAFNLLEGGYISRFERSCNKGYILLWGGYAIA